MKKELRNKWVNTRFNKTEYDGLLTLYRQSTCQDLGNYIRRVALNKPVNLRYRNQSIDDFLADMIGLRKELNAIGVNFNQAVHRLHTLQFVPDIQHWVMINEQDKTQLFRQIETISNRINELHKIWSRE